MAKRQNVNKMMAQVQQMQEQMRLAQEELAKETVSASAGGGAVKATMTGGMELVSIEIDPEVVDPEDVEMLQDMVLAATNEALRAAEELRDRKLGESQGGFDPMSALDALGGLGGLGGGGAPGGGAPNRAARRAKKK